MDRGPFANVAWSLKDGVYPGQRAHQEESIRSEYIFYCRAAGSARQHNLSYIVNGRDRS